MKIGQIVTFYNADEKTVKEALLVAITGAGPSLYKTLTLECDTVLFEDVPHLRDAEPVTSNFWMMEGHDVMPAFVDLHLEVQEPDVEDNEGEIEVE